MGRGAGGNAAGAAASCESCGEMDKTRRAPRHREQGQPAGCCEGAAKARVLTGPPEAAPRRAGRRTMRVESGTETRRDAKAG